MLWYLMWENKPAVDYWFDLLLSCLAGFCWCFPVWFFQSSQQSKNTRKAQRVPCTLWFVSDPRLTRFTGRSWYMCCQVFISNTSDLCVHVVDPVDHSRSCDRTWHVGHYPVVMWIAVNMTLYRSFWSSVTVAIKHLHTALLTENVWKCSDVCIFFTIWNNSVLDINDNYFILYNLALY